MALKRKNYLNNRDLLKEIHKSKNTFCSYVSEEDADYDIIIDSLDEIDQAVIDQAKVNRADRLARIEHEKQLVENPQIKLSQINIPIEDIKDTDLVFRVNTYDHIPLEPGRKKNPKTVKDNHARINFPPFQHYRLTEDREPKCVGKSHWIGGMDNGYFCLEHGKINNKLAHMFVTMTNRYADKWNWRGYSYNDEMRQTALLQLSQVGLQFDESKGQNPFAYYTATIHNSFTRVLNLEKRNQDIRDDILEMNNLTPSNSRQNSNAFQDL